MSQLEKLSDTYKFCPNCKTELTSHASHKSCSACGKSYFFNAQPTVSCFLRNEKGEYLLIRREVNPFKGWWDFPGGFVDPGESLEEAVKREVKEETNVDIKNIRYIGSGKDDYNYEGVLIPVIETNFVAEFESSANIMAGDDASDFGLFTVENLPIDEVAFENQRITFKKYIESLTNS